MRKKKILIEAIRATTDNIVVLKDEKMLHSLQGKWASFFNTPAPIVLEVGMGTGGFLKQLIDYNESQQISRNYIGMEIKEARVARAFQINEPYIAAGIIKFIIGWANHLSKIFGSGEISEVYLNFSDPWPKDRDINKRLVAPGFLESYKSILKKGGDLYIKTDNKGIYELALLELPNAGFKIKEQSEDLHSGNFLIKNFVTEFENKFLISGKNIYYLHAKV